MNKILVKLNYCWADEFDVDSLWMTTEEEYKEFLDELQDCVISDEKEIYFGTNEFVSFSGGQS